MRYHILFLRKIKVLKKLLGQPDLYFLLSQFGTLRIRNQSNYQITKNVIEDNKEFIRSELYDGNEKKSYINTRVKIYKDLKQKSLLTLPPDSDSVTKAIKRVYLQIKRCLQSLKQNLTFPACEKNGWKLCDDNLIMVPVWFTGRQLPPTVMK